MNYWPRWINAITNATAHLSLMEMGAYDRLLDHYYKSEQPLPSLDDCCRIVRAMSKAEREAVARVLRDFFTLTDAGYTQERADQEIRLAAPKIEAARANGLRGGRPKRTQEKPSGFPAGTQDEPKSKAPHPQSTSIPSEQKYGARERAPALPPPADVDPQTWADWLALRKGKKAPVTQTVIDGAITEARKAGMSLDAFLREWCTRGSQGLKAEWLKPADRGHAAQPAEPAWRTEQRQRTAAFAGAAAAKPFTPTTTAEVIDVTARRLG